MKNIFKHSSIILLCFLLLVSNSCKKLSAYDMPSNSSIYENLSKDAFNFSVFKSLIDKTKLNDLLNSGSYTLFAPTNVAFNMAGYSGEVLNNMSMDSMVLLVKNHIVEGVENISMLADGQELTTLSGNKILIQKSGDAVYVDGGDITNPDESATNGVVHVINKLLVARSSIYDRIASYISTYTNNSFNLLLAAIDRASQGSVDIKQLLSSTTVSYTFFAPNDGAFKDGGYANVAAVNAADPEDLIKLLENQLVKGRILTTDFDTTNSKPLNSINNNIIYGDRIKQSNQYTYFYSNGISVSGGYANMFAGEGVVNVVYRFLPVPIAMNSLIRIQSDTSLTFFNAAVIRATEAGKFNFVKMLSDPGSSYTVFAINNNGFRAIGDTDITMVSTADPNVLSDMLAFHFANKRLNNINYANNTGMPTLYIYPNTPPPNVASINMFISPSLGFQVKGQSNILTYNVLTGNVVTTNGLLNIIDGVLTP